MSLLSAVSAACAHTVLDEDAVYDRCEIAEDTDALNAATCEHASGPSSTDGSCPETDLPRTMNSPLECPHPKTAPGGHALCLQCAVKPGVKADSVLLYYRKSGEWPSRLPMRLAPNGWFRATIPALVVSGHELEVFFEALDGIDQVATDGEWGSGHIITICGGRK